MTKMEKEAIKHFKNYENKLVYEINEKDKKYAKTLLNLIDKLQKENQELKEDNSHQWEERCRLTFELEELKEENKELEKTIDLIIDDFQMENYFVGMTNKEVREYYKKRKELKE